MGSLRSLRFVCAGVFGVLSVSLSAASGGPTFSNTLVKTMLSNTNPTKMVKITFDIPFLGGIKSGSNALGFDLDMSVTGPSGSSINAGNTFSNSRTNAYEMVDLTADVTGTYVTNVCRASKRDSGGRFDFGFAVAVHP